MSDRVDDRDGRPEAAADMRWSVVVPVKGGPDAKSRLQVPDGVDRLALARAIATDTLEATTQAVGASNVVVVTSDPHISAWVTRLGGVVVEDPGGGLNAAIALGAARAQRVTGPGAGVAVLLGDLPALHANDLRHALRAASAHPRSFVPDAEGSGTVLLCATDGSPLDPRFGSGSADAHESAGNLRLDLQLPGLRNDVDDQEALRTVLLLGVGRHTAGLLAHLATG